MLLQYETKNEHYILILLEHADNTELRTLTGTVTYWVDGLQTAGYIVLHHQSLVCRKRKVNHKLQKKVLYNFNLRET